MAVKFLPEYCNMFFKDPFIIRLLSVYYHYLFRRLIVLRTFPNFMVTDFKACKSPLIFQES